MPLVGRNIRLNCIHKQELRRNDPHSRSSKKSPFRPLFRAFYPHPANRSFLSAGGATHFLGPGKRVGPPTSPGHGSPAPRSTPPSAGTSAVRSHTDPPPLATACHRPRIPKDRTGPDLDERALYLNYCCREPGDSCAQIHPFLPTRRRSPVDRSLVAKSAQLPVGTTSSLSRTTCPHDSWPGSAAASPGAGRGA